MEYSESGTAITLTVLGIRLSESIRNVSFPAATILLRRFDRGFKSLGA